MSCTTHHYACECREKKFKELEFTVSKLTSALHRSQLRRGDMILRAKERGARVKELEKAVAFQSHSRDSWKREHDELYVRFEELEK